ncbi:MAG: hypothetical protein KGL39_17460 [Patescibacteria group bacterium]|nr:hypothetical protein [Patescibacteria group bacterium]
MNEREMVSVPRERLEALEKLAHTMRRHRIFWDERRVNAYDINDMLDTIYLAPPDPVCVLRRLVDWEDGHSKPSRSNGETLARIVADARRVIDAQGKGDA